MKNSKPPLKGKLLLSFLLNNLHPESMLADLEEIYHDIVQNKGIFRAKIRYWLRIITTIPSFFMGEALLNNYQILNFSLTLMLLLFNI